MSRIAGLISKKIALSSNDLISKTRLDPKWTVVSNSFKDGLLGWCGSHQPNIGETVNTLAVLDGVIYNRAEFSKKPTDAQILCELHEQYGFERAIQKINGDFAVALFDKKTSVLWLARDRFGIKPLFYTHNADLFAFSSRSSALLLFTNDPGMNRKYVAIFASSHYRLFDHEPERTPFEEILHVPAATILKISNQQVTQIPYWQFNNLPDFTESEEVLAERYKDLLLDAVKIRMNTAIKPAFTLSGGMDSSSVLASAVLTSGKKQHVFSAVYTDKTYDETEEIKSMLDQNAVKWNPIEVGELDIFPIVEKMVECQDEPVATATWLSHYLLCKEVKSRGFKTLFGGLGGDELNAGEYEYYFFYFADLKLQGKEAQLKKEIELWIHYHNHPIYRKNFEVVNNAFKEMVDLKIPGKCLPLKKRMMRYFHTLNPDFFDLSKFEPNMEGPFQTYLKNRSYHDIARETSPCSLRAEDRQCAAFGLNHFLPFFDYRLVEFMFRISGEFKIRDGITKQLLRKAMKGILPEETRTRIKKTGWNAPAHIWFAKSSKDKLLDLVHSQKFKDRGIYNLEAVETIISDHYDIVQSNRNEENHMMFLWQLINLELWFQKFIDSNVHVLK